MPSPSAGTSTPLARLAPVANGAAGHPVTLEFQGSSSIIVRGPATGVSYSFSPAEAVRNINAADAAVLLRTGSFRLMRSLSGMEAEPSKTH